MTWDAVAKWLLSVFSAAFLLWAGVVYKASEKSINEITANREASLIALHEVREQLGIVAVQLSRARDDLVSLKQEVREASERMRTHLNYHPSPENPRGSNP